MMWNDIRQEIAQTSPIGRASPADVVRRRKVIAAEEISGIPLIVYAADFTDESRASQYGASLQIDLSDKTGFLQALSDIGNGPLDVLIHSPGGSPSATESIVHMLRSRFDPIRFIVPLAAKSAATMLALSGDAILLGEAAELGPTDPQLRIRNDQRVVVVPASAAIDQFKRIHNEVTRNPTKLAGWLPIIRQYGPSFHQECINAIDQSEQLVAAWLERYMFRDIEDGEANAAKVAKWLATHGNFNSHSRPIFLDQMLEICPELKIKMLREESEALEAAIMDVYWSIDVTFGMSQAYKIIEHSSDDAAHIRLMATARVQNGLVQVQQQPQPQPQLNRQQRRQQQRNNRNR